MAKAIFITEKTHPINRGEKMGDAFLILYWTGPIGVGIFLVCLGGMIYLMNKADAIKKDMKKKQRRW